MSSLTPRFAEASKTHSRWTPMRYLAWLILFVVLAVGFLAIAAYR